MPSHFMFCPATHIPLGLLEFMKSLRLDANAHITLSSSMMLVATYVKADWLVRWFESVESYAVWFILKIAKMIELETHRGWFHSILRVYICRVGQLGYSANNKQQAITKNLPRIKNLLPRHGNLTMCSLWNRSC